MDFGLLMWWDRLFGCIHFILIGAFEDFSYFSEASGDWVWR